MRAFGILFLAGFRCCIRITNSAPTTLVFSASGIGFYMVDFTWTDQRNVWSSPLWNNVNLQCPPTQLRLSWKYLPNLVIHLFYQSEQANGRGRTWPMLFFLVIRINALCLITSYSCRNFLYANASVYFLLIVDFEKLDGLIKVRLVFNRTRFQPPSRTTSVQRPSSQLIPVWSLQQTLAL
jgi:hypothetical protein